MGLKIRWPYSLHNGKNPQKSDVLKLMVRVQLRRHQHFFFLLPKIYLCVEWVKDGWAAHTEAEVRIFGDSSSAFDQNLPGYIIFWTLTQILVVKPPAFRLPVACGHTSFLHATNVKSRRHIPRLLPIQCTWSRFLQACHAHAVYMAFPPRKPASCSL